jgi:hypothetical protein
MTHDTSGAGNKYPGNKLPIFLSLGRHSASDGYVVPDSLSLLLSGTYPATGNCARPDCQAMVIKGVKVYLATDPAHGGAPASSSLQVPFAGGLGLEITVFGPDAPLNAAEVFAHHLQLLGPDRANWTTDPIAP